MQKALELSRAIIGDAIAMAGASKRHISSHLTAPSGRLEYTEYH